MLAEVVINPSPVPLRESGAPAITTGRWRMPAFGCLGRSSPTPFQAHQPWNWHRPGVANSWPLRSPGILSRRVLCGFLPRRRQLLDQLSKNRYGTLAANSMLTAEQMTCQTDRCIAVDHTFTVDCEAYCGISQRQRYRSNVRRFEAASFGAACTDCNRHGAAGITRAHVRRSMPSGLTRGWDPVRRQGHAPTR